MGVIKADVQKLTRKQYNTSPSVAVGIASHGEAPSIGTHTARTQEVGAILCSAVVLNAYFGSPSESCVVHSAYLASKAMQKGDGNLRAGCKHCLKCGKPAETMATDDREKKEEEGSLPDHSPHEMTSIPSSHCSWCDGFQLPILLYRGLRH